MSIIITIGREFGSGGRELGKRIAEQLGIAYYDREVVSEIAKKTDLAFEYVQQIVEQKPLVYYPITIGNSFSNVGTNINKNNTSIYVEQSNVIKELAQKTDCVIVGRCADYILKEMNPFRIFVYADMESKMRRCREKGEVSSLIGDKKLSKMIKGIDKNRSRYYEFYTSQKWGDKLNYDLMINTSNKSIKEVVNEIVKILK